MESRTVLNWRLSALALLVAVFVIVTASRSQPFVQVDVGGHNLRVLKIGSGKPTVVFENGGSATLETWEKVSTAVSKFATVVIYDRASTGRSELGPNPRDALHIVSDLHNMLNNTESEPPYILVGWSRGGLFARTFAGKYSEEVSALILIDPALDDNTDDLVSWESSGKPEYEAIQATMAQTRESIVPPSIPIYLIAAAGSEGNPYLARVNNESIEEYEQSLVEKVAAYSNWIADQENAKLIVTRKSGHAVLYEQPQLIVNTIREAIESSAKNR